MNWFMQFLEWLFSGLVLVSMTLFCLAVIADAFGYWDNKKR